MIEIPSFDELAFEEESHVYKLNGAEIPSVTTIMKPLSASLYHGVDDEVLRKAAERGTAVHNAIENYLQFGIVDIAPEYQGYMDAFLKWLEDFDVKPLATESRVYHKTLRYAGTADMPAIVNGQVICVDYKTSASVNKMLTGIQLEAYAKAYESHGIKFDGKAILHLKGNGKYSWVYYDKNDIESWEVFGALLKIQSHIRKYKRR